MQRYIQYFSVLALLLPLYSWAQPSNNNLANALTLSTNASQKIVDTTGATLENLEIPSSCLEEVGASVWFSYTSLVDETVTIDTFGSDYNTLLSIWQGSEFPLTEVACNDDSDTEQSKLSFEIQRGEVYFISVTGVLSETGELVLNTNPIQPLVNDNLADATDIMLDDDGTLTLNQSTASASLETSEATADCATDSEGSVWFKYTADADQRVVFDTVNSDFNTILSVWTGDAHPLAPVACATTENAVRAQLSIDTTQGTTYYIAVAGREFGGLAATGLLSLNIRQAATNSLLESAIEIKNLPFENTQMATGAQLENAEVTSSCAPADDVDAIASSIWFSYQPSEDLSNVVISTLGSSYDTVLSVWTGETHPLEELACNDNVITDLEVVLNQSQLAIAMQTDTHYFIGVAAKNNAGQLKLSVKSGGVDLQIAQQPQSSAIQSGDNVELSVVLNDENMVLTPIEYQWYAGNSGDTSMPINGATQNTFTTPVLLDTTNYWVSISNPSGTLFSNTAVITVEGGTEPFVNNGLAVDSSGVPTTTEAHFTGSIVLQPSGEEVTQKEGCNQLCVSEVDQISVTSTIKVDPAHIGMNAELVMVGLYNNGQAAGFYMRNTENVWLFWDVAFVSLVTADTVTSLPSTLVVKVFEGQLLNLPGDYTVYVGYRLMDNDDDALNGHIIYSGTTINFTVLAAGN